MMHMIVLSSLGYGNYEKYYFIIKGCEFNEGDFIRCIKKTKNYKLIAWIFILVILLLIVFYPIIDANFLYYKRVSNRIEILEKITNIEEEKLDKNDKLKDEYNSILGEISDKENNYLNNIFITEDSNKNNKIKFISSAWMFVLVGIILPFTKDKSKGKRTWTNFWSGIFCLALAGLFGFIGCKIPTIINVIVNIILYQIIMVYLAYTIATAGTKK